MTSTACVTSIEVDVAGHRPGRQVLTHGGRDAGGRCHCARTMGVFRGLAGTCRQASKQHKIGREFEPIDCYLIARTITVIADGG